VRPEANGERAIGVRVPFAAIANAETVLLLVFAT
jgi:hypothetical protein